MGRHLVRLAMECPKNDIPRLNQGLQGPKMPWGHGLFLSGQTRWTTRLAKGPLDLLYLLDPGFSCSADVAFGYACVFVS